MKQSNHHFSYRIDIAATKEKVWQVLTNVSIWHVWDTELKKATLKGDFELNAQGELIPKKGPKLKFFISEFSQKKTYTFKTKMPLGYLVITRNIKEENGMVSFTDDIQFTGFFKYVFGIILGRQFKKVLPKVMLQFKHLVEQK